MPFAVWTGSLGFLGFGYVLQSWRWPGGGSPTSGGASSGLWMSSLQVLARFAYRCLGEEVVGPVVGLGGVVVALARPRYARRLVRRSARLLHRTGQMGRSLHRGTRFASGSHWGYDVD